MATRNPSFEEILEEKPTLDELCEHIRIGSKWYQLGIQLKLNAKKLEDIHKLPDDSIYKTTKMFELWLDTKLDATRRQVIDALRKEVIEEITVAHEYEQMLRKSSSLPTRMDSQSLANEATGILQCHNDTLSQCLINPVKVSQLLFSERFINEETLDKMESVKGSLDEKKTTLLSAIHTTISSDHKKLKVLATVLSKFEETKMLSERIISEYVQKYPDDDMTAIQEIAMTGHSGHQYQGTSDSMEGIEYDHTMEDLEYQQSHEMTELSTSNTRKRLRKDKEISDEDLIPKKKKLYLEAPSDSNEQASLASDILRCHYGTLSQCLKCPVSVAQLLHDEGVISNEVLVSIRDMARSKSEENALFVLLQAVRHAVHTNYHNLEVFASVLLKQTSNVPCANAIIQDCRKAFPDYDLQVTYTGSSEGSQTLDKTLKHIPIPRKLDSTFGSIRKKFGIAFSKTREAINKSSPPLDKLKQFLRDGYSYLKSQIAHSTSIDDVLDVVNDHCTLINISCLEGIVERFDIKEAETYIQAYKNIVQSFCKETKASLCLEETLKEGKSRSLLKCETAIFVLDWDPTNYTLQDIRDIIAESVEENIQIRVIREGRSIIVTCFFPLSLTTSIIVRAQETLEEMKKKGLIQLTVGYCTIYDKHQRDKEVKTIVEENTKELRSHLELEQTIRKKMTMQMSSIIRQNEETREMKEKTIEDLTSLVKTKEAIEKNILSVSAERQKELETLQEIITSLTLQVRERDQQIEELKQSLKDLAFIPKVRKPVTDQRVEETQTKSIQEESTHETTESPLILELNDQLKGSADNKDETTPPKSPVLHDILKDYDDNKETKDEESDKRGHTGSVLWNDDDNSVWLSSPSVLQSEDVISKLIKEQQTGKEWSIDLSSSSPESTAVIINNLNKCTVRRLHIDNTSLDSKCVSILSEILKTNKTIKRLRLSFSSLTGVIKQVSDSLFNNKTLEQLVLWDVTGITDEDITHLSTMLSSNTTLKVLYLYNCNITDNGVRYICEGLTKNQTLTMLNIGRNRQITSVSTSTIADLIQTTTSLTTLYLYDTSLNNDDIKTICTSLNKNTTIRKLYLSSQHREYCKKLDSYQVIKDRLLFV